MGFMDSYKRLEKLCRDSLNDDRGVSAYIDEMLNTPRGASAVDTWNADLKQLKHYRWMRNQIAHDPERTEENMCSPADEKWIKAFCKRIQGQTDPLALYRAARKSKTAAKPKAAFQQPHIENRTYAQLAQKSRKDKKEKNGGGLFLTFALLLILLLLVLVQVLWEMNILPI